MSSQPKIRVGANTPSKPRRANTGNPVLSTFFVLMALASLLIVPGAVAILVWALGWSVLLVLGAAFVLFVAILMVRDALVNWRAPKA